MAAKKTPEPAKSFYDMPMNSIGYLTRITFRSFSRNLERRTIEHGVSAGQWPFLRALWNEEGMTQRELSRRVAMREPTTVTALNGMERVGFIKRVPSKEDRRKVHIFLTAKGRRLREKLIPCVAEVNAIASRDLDPADIAVLRRVLLKMSENLTKEEENYLKSHLGVTLPMGSETP